MFGKSLQRLRDWKNDRTRFGLTETEYAILKTFFSKYPEILKVFIYGSRANNTYRKTSDIDIGVLLNTKDKYALARIRTDAEELPLIYEIDILDESNMPDGTFKTEYEKTKKLLYSR